jgi:hypothetical protein
MFRNSFAIAGAVALACAVAPVASAQVMSIDEGSFTLIRDGERVGREDFSIRSTLAAPGGRTIVAQATIVLGSRRLLPGLNADTAGFPLRVQSEVRDDRVRVESYSGQTARDHYSSRAQRPSGESAREFRLPVGTVAADDEVMHQLWFIARRGAGAVVPVLVPQRNLVELVRVSTVANERLTIDDRDLEARHLRLRVDGSPVVRDVWVDSSGRVLKVEIPARKWVAVRDEAPRGPAPGPDTP